MEILTLVLLGVILLFFIFLAMKNLIGSERICAICFSVLFTWIFLLLGYFWGLFFNKIIIAILMGMSVLGIYYVAEKKVKKRFLVFRLPFLLTLIFVVYFVLEEFILESFILLGVLWVFFILIYSFKFNGFAKKLVECCKKW